MNINLFHKKYENSVWNLWFEITFSYFNFLDTNICKQMEFSRILIWNLACHNFDNGGVSLYMKWEMCNHLNSWAMNNQSWQGNGHLNRWWGILKSRSISLPSRFLTGMEVVRQGERNVPRQGSFFFDWGSFCLIFSTQFFYFSESTQNLQSIDT